MSPVIFSLFGFEIRWYSVLILIGIIIAFFLINSECSRFQIKKDFIFNMVFWGIIWGIIGARLYYVIFNWGYYSEHLNETYRIWEGGLAIHGGFIAGLITILIYCHKYHVNTKKILDIVSPALLIAQAIGRWGNFFNSEAYGSIVEYSTLVKFKIIPQFVIDNMYINGAYHLPMFYFESLLCIIGFIFMLIYRRRKFTKNGQVFSVYLIWYGLIRFFIEIFRSDSLMLGSFKVAQVVSVIMILIGLYLFVVQQRKPKLEELYNSRDSEIKF